MSAPAQGGEGVRPGLPEKEENRAKMGAEEVRAVPEAPQGPAPLEWARLEDEVCSDCPLTLYEICFKHAIFCAAFIKLLKVFRPACFGRFGLMLKESSESGLTCRECGWRRECMVETEFLIH